MAPKKKRVVIVDDHPLLRERLTQLINHQPDLMVTGEAESAENAMELIQKTCPDLAIIDITLKGSSGLELIKDAKALPIDLPMLVLSMHEESLYAARALRAGAAGYITKHQTADDKDVSQSFRDIYVQIYCTTLYSQPAAAVDFRTSRTNKDVTGFAENSLPEAIGIASSYLNNMKHPPTMIVGMIAARNNPTGETPFSFVQELVGFALCR